MDNNNDQNFNQNNNSYSSDSGNTNNNQNAYHDPSFNNIGKGYYTDNSNQTGYNHTDYNNNNQNTQGSNGNTEYNNGSNYQNNQSNSNSNPVNTESAPNFTTYIIISIAITLLGAKLLGIISIILLVLGNSNYKNGNMADYTEKFKIAKALMIIGTICVAFFILDDFVFHMFHFFNVFNVFHWVF